MRLIIIDDDPLVCSSLQTILQAQGHTVVACIHDGALAAETYHRLLPDVVLMDIRMKETNGVEASRQILKQHPDARILFLTTFSDEEYIIQALTIGVKGYILKQNFEGIPAALEAIAQGQNVFNTEIVRKIPQLLTHRETLPVELSERELSILTLVAKGMNNKEIAAQLYLSEGTVRNYLSSLLSRLQLRDRTQLAIWAVQTNVRKRLGT